MLAQLKSVWSKLPWLIVSFMLIGSFLRLYRLPQIMQFSGDQGRDALRVLRMYKQHDLLFIGPVTSIGNMYLGPFYYYFMLPWLILSYPSPVGPTYAVAFLSIATIGLMCLCGKDLVGKNASIFASFLFAFSNVAVIHANFSWNPNPAPFFSLALIWSLLKAYQHKHHYWILVAVAFSILIQLHYLALLSLLPILIIWLRQLKFQLKNGKLKLVKNSFLTNSALAVLLGLLFLLPLVLFDLKHQGVNLQAFKDLMGGKNSVTLFKANQTFLGKAWSVLEETHGRSMDILFDMHFGQARTKNTFLVIMLTISTLILLIKKKLGSGIKIVLLFVLTGILGTSFYSHNLYTHYVLYLLPAVFLFYGWLLSKAWQGRVLGKVLATLVCLSFLVSNIRQYSFHDFDPNIIKLSAETKEMAEKIQKDERYNLVLFSESKDYYGQNYRYFLTTIENKAPLDPDFDDIADVGTLLIINELGLTQADILASPIYELNAFKSASYKQIFQTKTGTEFQIWRK